MSKDAATFYSLAVTCCPWHCISKPVSISPVWILAPMSHTTVSEFTNKLEIYLKTLRNSCFSADHQHPSASQWQAVNSQTMISKASGPRNRLPWTSLQHSVLCEVQGTLNFNWVPASSHSWIILCLDKFHEICLIFHFEQIFYLLFFSLLRCFLSLETHFRLCVSLVLSHNYSILLS